MESSPQTSTIGIDQLVPGMYVLELDIPWIESPFFKHKRMIKSPGEVGQLRKAGVKTLVIDLVRGCGPTLHDVSPENPEQAETLAAGDAKEKSRQQAASASPSRDAVSFLRAEQEQARNITAKVKELAEAMLGRLERQEPVDTKELTPLIEDTLNSLGRNNQALMSFAHMSRKSQKLTDHAFAVFALVLNMALKEDLATEDVEALALAALLHEAGWLQIPLQLMGKRTAYTRMEAELVQKHPQLGVRTLKASELPPLVYRLIEEHHEACDGSGYPKGLTKNQLHPLSRLLQVADSYDARIHQLEDQPGILPTNALRSLYLDAEKGMLDEEAVAVLISMLGVFPVTSAVQLNTGEKAVVVQVPPDNPLHPLVRICYDVEGKPVREEQLVDLSSQHEGIQRSIERALNPSDPGDDPARKLDIDPEYGRLL